MGWLVVAAYLSPSILVGIVALVVVTVRDRRHRAAVSFDHHCEDALAVANAEQLDVTLWESELVEGTPQVPSQRRPS